jgi:hypothetical protein
MSRRFKKGDQVITVKTGSRWYCGGDMKSNTKCEILHIIPDREDIGLFYRLNDGFKYHETELVLVDEFENIESNEPKKSITKTKLRVMEKGDKVILTSTREGWRWGNPGWFYDGMRGEFVGYGDGFDDLLVKIKRHSHVGTYHFTSQEISVHDAVSTKVTKPKTTKSETTTPKTTKSKTTTPKTKSTFNISFGY